MMTSGDLRDRILYPTHTQIKDSFSCSTLNFYFKISFHPELPKKAEMMSSLT